MTFFKKKKILAIILLILSLYLYKNYFCLVDINPKINRNSSTYINDLYASDERIYKNYLDSTEKIIYRKLITSSLEHTLKVNTKINNNKSDISKVYNAILVDHPELLNFGSLSYTYNEAGDYEIIVNSATPLRFITWLNMAKIQRIIQEIKEKTQNMSDYGKIRYVYDWIGKNTKYDKAFTYMAKNQSAYNVFINKNAVCAGFAKASQIIFQNIGIESYGVLGETSGAHMWNIIKYKGKYYFFDATVAASLKEESKHYYDGLKQTTMENYRMYNPEWYPEIEKIDLE